MTLPTVAASPEALQQLPTPARPRLDPADVLLLREVFPESAADAVLHGRDV